MALHVHEDGLLFKFIMKRFFEFIKFGFDNIGTIRF